MPCQSSVYLFVGTNSKFNNNKQRKKKRCGHGPKVCVYLILSDERTVYYR